MRGQCSCGNLKVHWRNIDLSLVPRLCQCDFCRARNMAYVSKPGTEVTLSVANPGLYTILRQGTETSDFHCCTFCDTVVLVSCAVDGTTYGVLNANCLDNPQGFGEPVSVAFGDQPVAERLERRQRNWCAPVRIHLATAAP